MVSPKASVNKSPNRYPKWSPFHPGTYPNCMRDLKKHGLEVWGKVSKRTSNGNPFGDHVGCQIPPGRQEMSPCLGYVFCYPFLGAWHSSLQGLPPCTTQFWKPCGEDNRRGRENLTRLMNPRGRRISMGACPGFGGLTLHGKRRHGREFTPPPPGLIWPGAAWRPMGASGGSFLFSQIFRFVSPARFLESFRGAMVSRLCL